MAAYWIARARLTDLTEERRAGLRRYVELAQAALDRYPSETLSRGARTEILEGTTHFDQYYIHKFPTMEDALALYHSPEYQEASKIRREVCEGELVIVDGVDSITLP